MKSGTIKILGGIAIAYILFSSFKKKTATATSTGNVNAFDYQSNTPSSAQQVFSRNGTIVYDNNGGIVYTYNSPGIGMTMTGQKDDMFSVVIGTNFMNGIPGFVFKDDVQILN
jgi:hypothetical protein